MSFLLLYIAKGKIFDKDLVKHFWTKCPGVTQLVENAMIGAALSANFEYGTDSTIVELKADLETVALSGAGKASIQMAFQLQSAYPEPLHLIDDNYSFDFIIKDFQSPDELAKAVYSAMSADS